MLMDGQVDSKCGLQCARNGSFIRRSINRTRRNPVRVMVSSTGVWVVFGVDEDLVGIVLCSVTTIWGADKNNRLSNVHFS
jgi:hypothetical protein